MLSFESPPSSSSSPETQAKLGERIKHEMRRIIIRLEPLYRKEEDLGELQRTPLTQARYRLFEQWLDQMTNKGAGIKTDIEQERVAADVSHLVRLYEALADIAQGRPASESIRARYELAPDEFLLEPEDLPDWRELPPIEEIKTYCKLDTVWDYYDEPGWDLKTRFTVMDMDLVNIGYAVADPAKRQAFLQAVDVTHLPEVLPPARLFYIDDLIGEKQKKKTESLAKLTTKEVLEAFDEAGVRPATMKELLAYSKKYWKPKTALSDTEKAQRANATHIYALGSVFSPTLGGDRTVPHLSHKVKDDRFGMDSYDDEPSGLHGDDFNRYWYATDRFLVFRKEIT